MRTTVDIDDPVLKELKALQAKEGKSLGRIVSDLLAQALHQQQKVARQKRRRPTWISRPMRARLDLADTEALYASMECPSRGKKDRVR